MVSVQVCYSTPCLSQFVGIVRFQTQATFYFSSSVYSPCVVVISPLTLCPLSESSSPQAELYRSDHLTCQSNLIVPPTGRTISPAPVADARAAPSLFSAWVPVPRFLGYCSAGTRASPRSRSTSAHISSQSDRWHGTLITYFSFVWVKRWFIIVDWKFICF